MVGLQPQINDYSRKTLSQTCELLGVHRNTINEFIRNGLMPEGLRIGKYVYFYGKDIKECWSRYFAPIL